MAPKRSSLLENPPAASSSEEEEEFESEEEEVEEEPAAKVGAGDNESDSDDSDNDGSDSDDFVKSTKKPSDHYRISAPIEKPSKQTPAAKPSKPKKTASKPTVSTPTKPSATTRKRPLKSENVEKEKESKIQNKKKKVDDGDGEKRGEKMSFDDYVMSEHKNPFARLWNEDDEIAVLKVMVNYVRKGIDPTSDLEDLLETVKNSIHFDVNKEQLSNKVKRLKRKYHTNLKKGKDGDDPTFSKPHDTKCYQMMKEIWGGKSRKDVEEAVNGNGERSQKPKSTSGGVSDKPKTTTGEVSAKRKTGELADKELEKVEEENMSLYPCLNDSVQSTKNSTMVSQSLLNEGLSLLGEPKVKELEMKWRKLQTEELQSHLKRLDLEREEIMAVLNAIKASDS